MNEINEQYKKDMEPINDQGTDEEKIGASGMKYEKGETNSNNSGSNSEKIEEGTFAENRKTETDRSDTRVTDVKDIPEINLDQSNSAESVESQQNSVHLAFGENFVKAINVNVNSINSSNEQSLHFNDFQQKNYREDLKGTSTDYIDFLIRQGRKDFFKSRIAVINNSHEDEIAMAAIESIVFDELILGSKFIFSCNIEQQEINFNYIISQFRRFHKKNLTGNKPLPAVLVIYDNQTLQDNSNGLLKPVLHKGGVADTITNTLQTENFFIIYLCNDIGLYKTMVQEKVHFALSNISALHLYLFEKIKSEEKFIHLIALVEKAYSECDWLSSLTFDEQKLKLAGLIDSNELELELNKRIKSVNIEEKKAVTALAADPVHSVVLFVTTFFEGININEFDNLARILISGFKKNNTNENIIIEINKQINLWETNGDEILAKCGIEIQTTLLNFSSFSFGSISRKENAKKIFFEKFTLYVLRKFDLIQQTLLLKEESLSEQFMNGFTTLAFTAAAINPKKYLFDVCLNIVDALCDTQKNERQLKIIFNRVLFFIKKWSGEETYYLWLERLYQHLAISPEYRGIMGAILTYTCVPFYPANLEFLKLLLDNAGQEENFIRFKIPRIIVNNYIDEVPLLLTAIDKWIESSDEVNIPKSYACFKCSTLFLFYESRFSWSNDNTLNYHLIRKIVDNTEPKYFKDLFAFIFSGNSSKAFNEVFSKTIQVQLHNKKMLEKAQTETLYEVYAYVLIDWYFLLSKISSDINLSFSVYWDKLRDLLQNNYYILKPELLRSGLQKAIRKYNVRIINEGSQDNQNGPQRIIFKNKRDYARIIMQILEPIT